MLFVKANTFIEQLSLGESSRCDLPNFPVTFPVPQGSEVHKVLYTWRLGHIIVGAKWMA